MSVANNGFKGNVSPVLSGVEGSGLIVGAP